MFIHIVVFWSSSFILRVKAEAEMSSKMLVPYSVTTRHHSPEDHDLNLIAVETKKKNLVS
jgi:hypothetical protein